MKPTRGHFRGWYYLPKERRSALLYLSVLLLLLGTLVLYQWYSMNGRSLPDVSQSKPVESDRPLNQQQESEREPNFKIANTGSAPAEQPPQLQQLPLSGQRPVLNPFGFGYSEIYADFRLHPGVDYAAAEGEPVVAVAAGRISEIVEDPLDGRSILLEHSGGMMTRYSGLGEVMVSPGLPVQAGQVIAQVGLPGPSRAESGIHLHFQVLQGGEPVDPAIFLPTSSANE